MKFIFSDDVEIHRDHFTKSLEDVKRDLSKDITVLSVVDNGQKLVEEYKKFYQTETIDCVFTDIRMPVMDGLTALVQIKHLNPDQKVIMVSSEDVEKMNLLVHNHDSSNKDLDLEKKFMLVNKICDRVKLGKIEEGKINSVLEGCEKLALDPIVCAKHIGASGYLKKPYDKEKVKKILEQFNSSSFVCVGD